MIAFRDTLRLIILSDRFNCHVDGVKSKASFEPDFHSNILISTRHAEHN